MDLTTMTFAQLRELQVQVTEAIKVREKTEQAAARQQIFAIAHSAGLSLQELIGSAKSQPKKTVAVRYQHPTDATLHWTGRGRQPLWIEQWLASGRSLSDIDVTAMKA